MGSGLPGPISVIPNPIDTDLFSPARDRDPDRLVAVGRLEADKRPDVLLRGFAIAHAKRPSLKLEIIGSGPDREAMVSLAREIGVGEAVTFLGHIPRDQVASRVSTAIAFVHAAQVETFGLAVAESLAAGVPVVAPDATALPELIDASNGILFPPADEEALADGALSIISREYDSQAVAQSMRSRFSFSCIGTRLARAYSEALE